LLFFAITQPVEYYAICQFG